MSGAMAATLSGKWVWLWNWRRCAGGDAAAVAERLRSAGCRGAVLKAHDGPHWFDQGAPWREIARTLKAAGIAAGGWGYFYGNDIAGEAQRAIETIRYGEADLFVLDVESEFEGQPQRADELCRRIREEIGASCPLYFSSFALARYHRSFPYAAFSRHCTGAAPQAYWNAFRHPALEVLAQTYEDYLGLGIPPAEIFPVAGLYREGTVSYPDPNDVAIFMREAAARGSSGVSFWSYEHMDGVMWDALSAGAIAEEEAEMSSREFEQVDRALRGLTTRVERLESKLANPVPPAPPRRRTYTVRKGDSLSAIAQRLGLSSWHALYEANREIIGPDPDLIRPGQVLVVPAGG